MSAKTKAYTPTVIRYYYNETFSLRDEVQDV